MLTEYVQPLIQYLHEYPKMGQLIAFLIALAESLPIVGTIVPGSVTMTAIGTLIGTAILPPTLTLFWASVGALTGDCLGFIIGALFKEQLPYRWPFKKWPHFLEKSEVFFQKHGGKSIIIGRFVGPARSTVPLVAGLLKMKSWRFILAAIPSAILWAIVYTLPGILIGAISLELPPEKATEFILVGVVCVVALWLLFWAIQYFFKNGMRFLNRQIDRLWHWLYTHHTSKPFIRYLSNAVHPEDHLQLGLLLCAVLFLLLFLALFLCIRVAGPHFSINLAVFHLLQSIRTPSWDEFFTIITLLGDTKVMMAAGLLFSIVLFLQRQKRDALHFAILICSTAAAVMLFKYLGHSPRPTGFHVMQSSFSFPSGHTAMTLVVTTFCAFLSTRLLPRRWHILPYFLSTGFTVLVAFSRLYLGAHWLTDITGSFLLGSGLVLLVIVHYRRALPRTFVFPPRLLPWFFSWLTVWFIPTAFYAHFKYDYEQHRYQRYWPALHITMQAWWQTPTRYLPVYRHNRLGQVIAPFNLQWAAPLGTIKKDLNAEGWEPYNRLPPLQSTLKRLVSYQPVYHMPLLPWLYQGKPPVLIYIRKIPHSSSILELRLWATRVTFRDSKLPLWIGSVNYHAPAQKLFSLHHRFQIVFQSKHGIEKLIAKFNDFQFRVIQIPKGLQPKKIVPLNWSGDLLLLKPKS